MLIISKHHYPKKVLIERKLKINLEKLFVILSFFIKSYNFSLFIILKILLSSNMYSKDKFSPPLYFLSSKHHAVLVAAATPPGLDRTTIQQDTVIAAPAIAPP